MTSEVKKSFLQITQKLNPTNTTCFCKKNYMVSSQNTTSWGKYFLSIQELLKIW